MTDQKRILIIDDEPSIRDSLASFFEDQDFIVFTAEDGEKGLDIVFNTTIDIVLTDLRMPRKDGIQVMKAIHARYPETPMIVVSGAGEKEDVIKALRMGAKDYITKPIEDLDRMIHTVKQVLENKRLIDENERYRNRLEKSEQQYRTITENIAEGVFAVDAKENISYANQAFCTMLGYSNAELMPKNLKNLSTKDSFKLIQQQTLAWKKGSTSRYEIQLVDKQHQPVHAELACRPVFDNTNTYQGTITVVRDITQTIALRKKFEKFLVQKETLATDVVPICANCKTIRIKDDTWIPIEDYFTDMVFSHGICPACCDKLYPEFNFSDLE